jgi:16S rRNA G966 N2-methylase RsmD
MPWQAKPTPRAEVVRILQSLKPSPGETFVDFGCGFDARFVIEAVQRYGCRGIGVEIDPARAASARQYVAEAGLSEKIEIIEGDARTADIKADVGVVYLEPELLESLKPQLTKLNRFASYQHAIPGLAMTRNQDAYHWQRLSEVSSPATQAVAKQATWGGQLYSGPICTSPNCAMCNSIRTQLARSQVAVQVQPAKSQPVVTYQRSYTANCAGCRNCVNGNCYGPVRRLFRGFR